MDCKKFFNLILAGQTLFALPFALLGVVFAGGADLKTWALTIVALAAARAAGMSFNMVIDAKIDAKNPRTKDRLIPKGEVAPWEAWMVAALSGLVLVLASFFLNPLCFYLSFAAIFLLFIYSFFKRFSASSHFFLGFVEAAAPMGGYLAAQGQFSMIPFALSAIILTWIAGLDIIYSLQDMEFDIKERLHSIPAALGKKKSLFISAACYMASLFVIVWLGFHTEKQTPYWIGASVVGAIFCYQQALAWKEEPPLHIKKIFKANMFISPALFFGAALDMLLMG